MSENGQSGWVGSGQNKWTRRQLGIRSIIARYEYMLYADARKKITTILNRHKIRHNSNVDV